MNACTQKFQRLTTRASHLSFRKKEHGDGGSVGTVGSGAPGAESLQALWHVFGPFGTLELMPRHCFPRTFDPKQVPTQSPSDVQNLVASLLQFRAVVQVLNLLAIFDPFLTSAGPMRNPVY